MAEVTVVLTAEDHARARRLARERNVPKRGASVRDRKVDEGQESLDIDVQGLLGEIAFERFSGLLLNQLAGLSGDGGVSDFVLVDGRTVQVKVSSHPQGRLIFGLVGTLKADLAVLLVPLRRCPTDEWDVLRVAGWITRQDFERLCYRKDLGYGENLCVDQSALSPSLQLLATDAPPMADDWSCSRCHVWWVSRSENVCGHCLRAEDGRGHPGIPDRLRPAGWGKV